MVITRRLCGRVGCRDELCRRLKGLVRRQPCRGFNVLATSCAPFGSAVNVRDERGKSSLLNLKQSSLDWALNHALSIGDTDIFPLPFEFQAIRHDWVAVSAYLASIDILEWNTRPQRSMLVPKARFGFRVATQLDPLDFLVYASIVYELGADIEARRIPKADSQVFSFRFLPAQDGKMFDPGCGYTDFVRASNERSEGPECTHVVVADIADFYLRIYHHRLENALTVATRRSGHVSAVRRLLKGWNETETFGIPVGNAPSRLLAELTISDIDEALRASGVKFVRFNDDYRIFASSYAEAYRHLTLLAELAYKNHGLTLQPQKTTILTVEAFRSQYLSTDEDRVLDSMVERFDELLDELNISNPYEPIDYDELTVDQKKIVDSLNLVEIFRKVAADQEEPDLALLKFVLRRLGQLDNDAIADEVLDSLNRLHPAFSDMIQYLLHLTKLSGEQRARIAAIVVKLLDGSVLSELQYHRMWALELFARSTQWDHSDKLVGLLGRIQDQASRRKLILALGRASQRHWFQTRWRSLFEEAPWPRRAFIAAASCLPPDARKHWYASIEGRLDVLERAVIKWARQHPFGE